MVPARVDDASPQVAAPRQVAISNWGLVGHEWAVRGLARSIAAGRVAHAYLLTGPHAIGKTTLARALAQALECTGANPPCGACAACQKIARDRHPDVQVLEGVPPRFDFEKDPPPPPRASDRERRTIRIRQIRDLEHNLSRAPFEGRWKIVILRRFEEAEEAAANAFLKTLEEPPAYARLILTSRDASLLLPTIASRCQVLALRPLPAADVQAALVQRWQVEPQLAHLLARLSGGRLGWAVRASADPGLLAARSAALDALAAALSEGRAERLMRSEQLAKKKESLPEVLEEWVGWWRDALLVKNSDTARITNVDRAAALSAQAGALSLEEIEHALKQTRETVYYLSQNANERLALDVLLLGLPRI